MRKTKVTHPVSSDSQQVSPNQKKISVFSYFLRTLPNNIIRNFRGLNALWQVTAIALTAFLVLTGIDGWYFKHTLNINSALFFPAVVLGAFLPIIVPVGLLVRGRRKKNEDLKRLGFMLGQAAIIGSFISSLYKAFSGRTQPVLGSLDVDLSREFHFGFWENGIFWGWPSSHTTIAFAMAVSLVVLYPKNNKVRIAALSYAFYVGLAISVSIHWFSEFVAGAIFGTVIGMIVGRSFKNYQTKPESTSNLL